MEGNPLKMLMNDRQMFMKIKMLKTLLNIMK